MVAGGCSLGSAQGMSWGKAVMTEIKNLSAKQIIERGICAWERADYEAALQLFQAVLENHPGFADVHNKAGLCLAMLGDPESALEEFEKALKISDTYCKRKIGYAEFSVTEGATVTSSGDSCVETASNHYVCTGAEGGYVNVEVCLDCAPEACNSLLIQCVHPYLLNQESCECERLSLNPADPGELEQANQGEELDSLSELAPEMRRCPPGYYLDIEARMCVPAEDPNDCFDPAMLMAVVPAECDDCPPGMHYNEEIGCCEPDERAILEPAAAPSCENFTLQLGTCGGSSQGGCTRPSQYSDAGSCTSAGCAWVPDPNIVTHLAYYCTSP